MTYRALKYVIEGLLTGDNKIPKEEDVVLALLGMAYSTIANKCQVLNLMTLDKSVDVVRLGKGQYLIRKPKLPTADTDDLDVDDDLCYVAASLVASYISKDKIAIHDNRAALGIRDYNAKVNEILESLKLQEDGRYDI